MRPPNPYAPQSSNGVEEFCGNLIERGIRSIPNPLARAIAGELHDAVKPELQSDLRRTVGNGTQAGRVLDTLGRRTKGILKRMKEGV